MNLEVDILFKTEGGNLYSLNFSEYKPNANIAFPVVEISLALKEHKKDTNPLKVFSFIIKKIEEYLSNRGPLCGERPHPFATRLFLTPILKDFYGRPLSAL